MNSLNWALINDGATFQALVGLLISFDDPDVRIFDRPGKDSGIDILSGDGKTVYQAKFRQKIKWDDVLDLALEEYEHIKLYKKEQSHRGLSWKGVEKWILVTTCRVNPHDDLKWNETVVSKFREEGLEARYWNLGTLDEKVIEHPEVIEAYFEGRNRVFLALPEVKTFLENDIPFGETYCMDYLGHEEDLKKFEDFLGIVDKRIFPVTGKEGIGKTRFLYECAKKGAELGYQVLWAKTETMTVSNEWIKGINPSKSILILIDDPDSASLLRQIIESVQTEQWKMVITLRSTKQNLVDELKWLNYKFIDNDINLPALPEKSSKKFIKNYLNHLGIEITDPPQEVYAEKLYQYTSGNPAWMCIALTNIQKNNRSPLEEKCSEEARRYIEELTRNMDDFYNKNKLIELLVYLSLFRRININESNICDFFYKMNILEDSQDIVSILEKLVYRKLVVNYGIEKRWYAIKPDLIRDFILKDKLLTPRIPAKITRFGEKIISQIINGDIPCVDEACTSLARIDIQNNIHLLTDRLFSKLETYLRRGNSTKIQYEVTDFLKNVQFANVRLAVKIYKDIFYSVPLKPYEKDCWGIKTICIDHENIKRKIVKQLYLLCHNDLAEDIIRDIFIMLGEKYKEELSIEQLPNDGANAKDWIHQLINKNASFDGISRYVYNYLSRTTQILETLKSEELDLFFDIAVTFLHIQRDQSYFANNSFYVRSVILTEHNELFTKIEEILTAIRKKISSSLSSEVNKKLVSIVQSCYQDRNYTIISEQNLALKESFISWRMEILEWTKGLLEGEMKDNFIAKSYLRGIWKNNLKYGSRKLNVLAKACEKVYKQDNKMSLVEVLEDWDSSERRSRLAGKKLLDFFKWNLMEIIDFLEKIKRTGSRSPHQVLIEIAAEYFLKGKLTDNKIKELLTSEKEVYRRIGMELAAKILRMMRENKNSEYRNLWKQFYAELDSQYQQEWFQILYVRSPFRPEKSAFSDFDWKMLEESRNNFDDHNVFKFAAVIGGSNWDKTLQYLDKIWDKQKNLCELQLCLENFASNLYLFLLKNEENQNDDKKDEPCMNFIFSHVVSILDPSNILTSHLKYLVEHRKKQPFSWLLDFLKKRIELKVSLPEEDYQNFKILPYDFNPNYWTDYSRATEKEKNEFWLLCENPILCYFYSVKMIQDLDPKGDLSCVICVKRLQDYIQRGNNQAICINAKLISGYPYALDIWRKCASIICSYSQTIGLEEKYQIYDELIPIRGIYRTTPGQIPPVFLKDLEEAKKNYEQEANECLKDFWRYRIQEVEAEIEREKENIEEMEEE